MLLAGGLSAQDLAGSWQGTLKGATKNQRAIVEITKSENGGWKALVHTDQTTEVLAADSVTLDGSHIRITIDPLNSVYEGTISAYRSSINETWKGGNPSFMRTWDKPEALDLRRATKKNA